MKIFFLIFLSSISAWARQADETVFTTVFYDDAGIIYVGLKQTKEKQVTTQITSFPYPNGAASKLKLPEEISSRDVIGILPDREKLFVITHNDIDKKDGPVVHLFNTKKNKWKQLGKISCPSFNRVKLGTTNLVFFCETNLKKGKVRVTPKILRLGKERLYRSGYMRFPEFLLRYKSATLLLEGNAPHWKKLRIKTGQEKNYVFRADDLFRAETMKF